MANTMDQGNSNLAPRLSSLETSVAALSVDVQTIAQSVNTLRDMISAQNRPQWGNLIAAVAVGVVIVGSIGASFIAPLTIELQNHGELLRDRGVIIAGLQNLVGQQAIQQNAQDKVSDAKFSELRRILDDVKANGSGITRERLAVLEHHVLNNKPPVFVPMK